MAASPTSIVLTGGPAAGKSQALEHLLKCFPDRLAPVREAATAVYRTLNTTWDKLDLDGQRAVQRAIYHLQLAQESATRRLNPGKVLLLDRGTIDGSAYWPDGPEAYWHDLRADAAAELQRYDAVIWLETRAVLGSYDGKETNTTRFENAPQAIAAGRLQHDLWASHPTFHQVPAAEDWAHKLARLEAEVGKLLKAQVQ